MHTLSLLYAMLCLPCLLCATHLVLLVSLHLCRLAYIFMHESLCLLVSSSLIPTISCGFTPDLDTQDLKSFLGFFLDGMCVVFTPIQWNYGHPIQTYMFVCPFVCLTCLFAPVWPSLYAFFSSLLSPLLVYWLVFLDCCMDMLGARMLRVRVRIFRYEQKGQRYKQEDTSPKRAMFSRSGGLASLCHYLSLSLSLLSLYLEPCSRFIIVVFYLGRIFKVWHMSVLHFLYLARPYPTDG